GVAAEEARAQVKRAERQAKNAAEEVAAAREAAMLLNGYVDAADPMLRLATNVYAEIDAVLWRGRATVYREDGVPRHAHPARQHCARGAPLARTVSRALPAASAVRPLLSIDRWPA